MSMIESEALPPEPPPMADPGGVPMPSEPPADLSYLAGGESDVSLTGGAPQLGSGVNIDEVSKQAAIIQRDKAARTAEVNAETEKQLLEDRARMQKQFEAAGIGPDEMKPWNADAAREKFKYDPIEAFGSIGSVFAIIASAFTNRPMENAMYGAAAAMEAVRTGNAQEHDRAYKAWQDNTNLAIKRQAIQNQQFVNATALFSTDMTLGAERAKLVATQYGDKQMSLLLDNGLYKEAIDLAEKRQGMAIRLKEALPKIALDNEKVQDLLKRTNGMEKGTPEYQRAVQAWQQDWNGRKYDEDNDFSRKWWQENPNGTSEQFAKAYGEWVEKTKATARGVETPAKVALTRFLQANPDATPEEINTFIRNSKGPSDRTADQNDRKLDIAADRASEIIRHNQAMEAIRTGGGDTARLRAEETARHNKAMEGIMANRTTGAPQAQEIERRTKELMESEGLSRTEAYNKAAAEVKAVNTAQTVDRNLLPAIEARRKELVAEGKSDAEARTQATREVKTSSASPSGNRLDDLDGMTDRVTLAENVIDKIDGLLLKHNAITGMGGMLTRPVEVVGNMIGSDATDRVQFARYIAELKEILPRVITGSNARPLAAEVGNINRIAAGMSLGDTGPNTLRAYQELRPVLAQIKQRLQVRRTGLPGTTPAATPTPAVKSKSPWADDPVAK